MTREGQDKRSRWPSTRRSVWRWHFWAGLFTAPVMIVASLTGAVLVFEDDIKLAIDSSWHLVETSHEEERTPLNVLRAVAELAAETDEKLSDVYVFGGPSRSVIFVFRDGPFDRRLNTRVAIDPYSSAVLGVRRDESAVESFMRLTTTLHESLFAGFGGRIIVELTTAWGVVLLISGVALWWPRAWSVVAGVWTIRSGGPSYRVWRDWHTVPSLYVAVVSILVLLSGLFLSSGTGMVWTAATFLTGGIPEAVIQPPQVEADTVDRIDLDAALEAARGERPEAPLYDIGLPFAATDPVRVVAGSAAEPIGTTYAYTHPSTGAVLNVVDQGDAPMHGQPLALAYGIHVGGIGGTTTKVLAFVVCVTLIASTTTGLVMWLIRRPTGKFGSPKRPMSTPSRAFIATAVALGVAMPSFGVSLVAVLLAQRLWRFTSHPSR